MKYFNGFSSGFNSFFKAIPFIFRNNIWWVFLIPLFLSVGLYYAGFSLIGYVGEMISGKIDSFLFSPDQSWLIGFLLGLVGGLVQFFLKIIYFFIFAYVSGYILLIILAPVFAWVSERTEAIVKGVDYPFSFSKLLVDIWRGILITVRNMLVQFGVTILIFIVTLLPLIGQLISPVTFILYFLITSYYYGFTNMYYTCERKGLSVRESVRIVSKNRGVAVANGMIFSFTLMIPFIGVMLAGFTSIIATVGATLAMNEIPELSDSKSKLPAGEITSGQV